MVWITAAVVALIVFGGLYGWFTPRRSQNKWVPWPKCKWPPISEDEFIRRCSPGVDRERALKVRRIVAEQLGVDYDRVYPEQNFVKDLGCD